jgi:6-phosphofructokinase 2
MSPPAAILVVCANPVLDIAFWGDRGSSESRQFFAHASVSGGGFGPNVARALHAIGQTASCHIAVGGVRGAVLKESLAAEGLSFRSYDYDGETRIAVMRLDDDQTTMLVSPSPRVPIRTLRRLFADVQAVSTPNDAILVGGSAPAGSEHVFLDLTRNLCRDNRRCCIDARVSDWQSLAEAAPEIIRIPTRAAPSRSFATGTSALATAASLGAKLALYSVNPTLMLARTVTDLYSVRTPASRAKNPFGAGDCFLAVLGYLLRIGKPLTSALRTAAASASASIRTPVPGHFDPSVARKIEPSICITHERTP